MRRPGAAPARRRRGVSWLDDALTLYGWAYHTSTPEASIPVEIYVGGPRDSGGIRAETITANRPRPEVNSVHGITGDHGFAWVVPAQYQSGAQEFYVYALDRTSNPSVRTLIGSPMGP